MADEIDRESYYRAAAEVWERGCRGEEMKERDVKRFRGLARDRFYTFMLSANHSSVAGDGEKVASLIRGFALDLIEAPGLEQEWRDSEFSEHEFGEMVTDMIESMRN